MEMKEALGGLGFGLSGAVAEAWEEGMWTFELCLKIDCDPYLLPIVIHTYIPILTYLQSPCAIRPHQLPPLFRLFH